LGAIGLIGFFGTFLVMKHCILILKLTLLMLSIFGCSHEYVRIVEWDGNIMQVCGTNLVNKSDFINLAEARGCNSPREHLGEISRIGNYPIYAQNPENQPDAHCIVFDCSSSLKY
jgi:hypothetical protein